MDHRTAPGRQERSWLMEVDIWLPGKFGRVAGGVKSAIFFIKNNHKGVIYGR